MLYNEEQFYRKAKLKMINHRNIRNRMTAIALACVFALSLAACADSEAAKSDAAQSTAAPAATAAPTPEPTPTPTPEPTETPLAPGMMRLRDEDGDGIIQYEFTYKGSTVYAMFILDPSRVFVGISNPEMAVGDTLDVMAERYGAVGGINAGGFLDEGGGTGGQPYGLTFSEGACINGVESGAIAGLSASNELLAGYYSRDDCIAADIRNAVTFGPVLIENGNKISADSFERGIGARTAIGQRDDGTIVMVVTDGRQGYSIGLTFPDMVNLLYDKLGCVTAINMDGGNSSCMMFGGELTNNPANQAAGTRTLPTAWLIRPLEAGYEPGENVAKDVIIAENALGETYEAGTPCDAELSARLQSFAESFVEAYYGYFGTKNADYYYPTLKQYVAEGSDLLDRMDQALMDRVWVNTYSNQYANQTFKGAYLNADGSYTIEYSLDVTELSNYWTYENTDTRLRITVIEAPESVSGFLATATN